MEEKFFTKKEIITIVLGVVLTVVSFCFYLLLNKGWLNILCGIFCFLHMIYLMYFQLANKDEFTKRERILFPTVLLVVFYGFFITLIILLNPLGRFYIDYILWVLYSSSSFIPLFYLVLLLLSFAP